MAPTRIGAWMAAIRVDYIESRMQTGETQDEATSNADQAFAQSFDSGLPKAHHHIFDVMAEGQQVGYVWVGPHRPGQLEAWWVWDVAIEAEHQRHGYGRQAMLLAEEQVRRLGGKVLGLNVFGYNSGARALYESLGYETTSLQMRKLLEP